MLSEYEINRAKRLLPRGFEYLDMSDEKFVRAFLACFDQDTDATVIIGPAGCGKSEIYKAVATYYDDRALCLAMTGIAARNLETANVMPRTTSGGLGIVPPTPYYNPYDVYGKTISALAHKDVVMIDEISMCSSNLLSLIIRHINTVNLGRKKRIKLLLFGDPMQLPAVFEEEKLKPIMESIPNLAKKWPFQNCPELARMSKTVHVLDKVYRQTDEVFKSLLGRMRFGICTESDINYLNHKVASPHATAMVLGATNNEINEINRQMLSMLNSPALRYDAEYALGTEVKDSAFSPAIELHQGERVVCTRNAYDDEGLPIYRNGTVGTIVGFQNCGNDGILPVVRSDDGDEFVVHRTRFEDCRFVRNEEGKYEYVPVSVAYQLALKPAYAMTFHRSQGLSLPSAHILVPRGKPENGMLYMGISRVRDPDGLTLSAPVSKEMFRASPSSIEYIRENTGTPIIH